MLENLNAILENLETETKSAVIDEVDTKCPLWQGAHSLHLVSIDKAKQGYTLTFANDSGEIMPSQFDDQVGNIWIRDLTTFIRSIKVALHMPATHTPKDVIEELEHPHNIYLVIQTSMKQWGLSMYNKIDFAQTAQL